MKDLEVLLDETTPLSKDDFDLLIKIMNQEFIEGKILISLPKSGTISPWSSKATDIAHASGFKNIIHRIERATLYVLEKEGSLRLFGFLDSILDDYDFDYRLIHDLLHDKMTHQILDTIHELLTFNSKHTEKYLNIIDIKKLGSLSVLHEIQVFNDLHGLGLDSYLLEYLSLYYFSSSVNPTDAELVMFAQVNSEHCRHKYFNGKWCIDYLDQGMSMFQMIKNTSTVLKGDHVLSAYKDNAAVLHGVDIKVFKSVDYVYATVHESIHTVMKVETHNHPTAVCPFEGSATGSGGEIRDEAAVGQGSKTKAGLVGFTVSDLCIPGYIQPWENVSLIHPSNVARPLKIMIDGPLGSSSYNNEFGRPCITGYFRTFLHQSDQKNQYYGYHKPIMIAGGIGSVIYQNIEKKSITPNSYIIVLGGPSMLIGIGGGAASSKVSTSFSSELDFKSVQRSNPEMQRKCQEVINQCSNNHSNIISSIHDVGAGGLSNAIPEIVHDSRLGAIIQLRDIPCDDPSMSPMEIWCNESQERYVLTICPNLANLATFVDICEREKCMYAIVGRVTLEKILLVIDTRHNNIPVNIPMDVLFLDKQNLFNDMHTSQNISKFVVPQDSLSAIAYRILHLPSVGSKSFLLTIGDRTVTGLVCRDQMVGKWQVPVSDVSVVAFDYTGYRGHAMCMGERPSLALISPQASARMSVCESLTNLIASNVELLSQVCMSANWMASLSDKGQASALYEAVKSVGIELCPELDICIPVGKDSLSMKTKWFQDGEEMSVTSPMSLVITAYGNVEDITKTLTPEIGSVDDSILLFIDLANGKQRLCGSAFYQVYNQLGLDECPDLESVTVLKEFWRFMNEMRGSILAYHDRSDGGLLTVLCEMAFCSRVGLNIHFDVQDSEAFLFNEELGAVIEIRSKDLNLFTQHAFNSFIHPIGSVEPNHDNVVIRNKSHIIFNERVIQLQEAWSRTSIEIQKLRGSIECADTEYSMILDEKFKGLSESILFPLQNPRFFQNKPWVAVLRDQGINGHVELAFAFYKAGFEVIDVHMTDLLKKRVCLDDFYGLACPGGFSYGDVLGAGSGWSKSILNNTMLKEQFKSFFERHDTFTIGVCNGCQMLSGLKSIIPGSDSFPKFKQNQSEVFESRLCMVEIMKSKSIFLNSMEGSVLIIPVAHGEGRVDIESDGCCMRYVDGTKGGSTIVCYPLNPNGSVKGQTGFSSKDGRCLILMPHPERYISCTTHTWKTNHAMKLESGAWMKLFENAREWVEQWL